MERAKLGTLANGVAVMNDMCNLLSVGVDPETEFVEYTEVVGADLTGAPVEAGFPKATWRWAVMPQSDFQWLLDFIASTGSGNVYLRTRNNSGASGFDFANYSAIMARPKAGARQGLLVRDVVIEFIGLEVA